MDEVVDGGNNATCCYQMACRLEFTNILANTVRARHGGGGCLSVPPLAFAAAFAVTALR